MARGQSLKLRKLAFQRDGGICAHCGADCERIKRVYWSIVDFEAQCFYASVLGMTDDGRTFWDADHILEVADGGSNDADNIQTLCVKCHNIKTQAWWAVRLTQPPAVTPVVIPTPTLPAPEAEYAADDPYANACSYLLWPLQPQPPWLPPDMKARRERALGRLQIQDESFDVSDDYVSS